MQIGMVGLGRMGGNMARRLIDKGGHSVVGFAPDEAGRTFAAEHGIVAADSVADLVARLEGTPRVAWAMVPAGAATEETVEGLAAAMREGDVIVDGGNSNWRDSRARAVRLADRGIHFVDSGTSGGIWGYDVGYCQMVGGADEAIAAITPALDTLAPPDGWLHTGPCGSGHFTKMVHNGIEYGLMQAYAEGFEILKSSEFELDLPAISHLWNQGSVVRSWLLELLENAYRNDPGMEKITGYVDDSGEGRWTVMESINESVPAPVIALSLMMRFRSRQPDTYSGKILSALRNEFGGHAVHAAEQG
jgi:6-phosphogluconate dehydrogenase